MRTIKITIIAALMMIGGAVGAQNGHKKPVFEKQNELIKGTYYYEDGNVKQEGTYKDGKLHGEWVSYDKNGKKIAYATYANGKKVGTWYFWQGSLVKKVNYDSNKIVVVSTIKDMPTLVSSEK
ncbi:toxin-antitoxin system YwqK family antitoxin [Zunongwangia sp.]|uniref:toxin-antitoxin system YwqK family antitoxin n=1 Tax=Zunongwangia sp. TaxID=1965325 RepID=UPI003AA994F8